MPHAVCTRAVGLGLRFFHGKERQLSRAREIAVPVLVVNRKCFSREVPQRAQPPNPPDRTRLGQFDHLTPDRRRLGKPAVTTVSKGEPVKRFCFDVGGPRLSRAPVAAFRPAKDAHAIA